MAEHTLSQASRHFAKIRDALPKQVARAEERNLREAKKIAVVLSSGPYSSAQLARMGHPYNKKKPHPPRGRADIINIQSGESGLFRSSWEMQGPVSSLASGEIMIRLVNIAPYSFAMWGTKYMIPRRIDLTIAQRMRKKRLARLEAALNRALSVR